MRIVRLVAIAFLTVAMAGAALASTAFAGPEFKLFSRGSLYVTAYGLTLILFTGENLHIDCLKSSEQVLLLGGQGIQSFYDHFLNCVTVNNATGKGCTVKGTSASEEGLILTSVLEGVLGLILPSRSAGILYLAEVEPFTANWINIAASAACEAPEVKIMGRIAAEIGPTGKLQTTGKLLFTETSGKQAISDISIDNGGLVAPKLLGFGSEVLIVRDGTYTASQAFEVT